MRERIAGLIGEDAAREATIGTFHAICARILRRDGDKVGPQPQLQHLRPRRPGGAGQGRAQEPGPGRQALRAGRDAGLDRAAQGRAGRCHDRRPAGRQLLRRDRRPGVRRVPAPAAGGRRGRLRRPADAGGGAVRAAPRGAGQVPGPLAADPGRRVPGHQPSAVPDLLACWPASTATWRWWATTTRASTPGAAPTCATSWTSSPTTPTPRS